jgi:hypothetical protein
VTGVDDPIIDNNVAYTIITGAAVSADALYSGINVPNVSVVNMNNYFAGVIVNPASGLVTTEAGGTATITVALTGPPTANVVLPLVSSDLTEGALSVSSLTFTPSNWAVPQSVTVTGLPDFSHDGDIAYSIVFQPAVSTDSHYNQLNAADIGVVNEDVYISSPEGILGDGVLSLFYDPATGVATIEGLSSQQFKSLAVRSLSGVLRTGQATWLGSSGISFQQDTTTQIGFATNTDLGGTFLPSNGFVVGAILPAGLTPTFLATDLTILYGIQGVAGTKQGDWLIPGGSIAWESRDIAGSLVGGSTFTISPNPRTGIGTLTVVDNGPNDANPIAGQFRVVSALLTDYTITQTAVPEGYAIDLTPSRIVDVSVNQLDPIVGIQGQNNAGSSNTSDFHARLFGDTNLDGDVDFDDMMTIINNYGMSLGLGSFPTWEDGDFDGDGDVDFDDAYYAVNNYNG